MAEQWRAVYRISTGELVSVGTIVAPVTPAGLALVDLTGQPDMAAQMWDMAAHAFVPRPAPTDDAILAALPRVQRLEPTAAAGKAALRDLLDEQVQEAAAWDWFAAKCAADAAFPAAAKTAAQTLADNEYQRAKRLLQAWRQAT